MIRLRVEKSYVNIRVKSNVLALHCSPESINRKNWKAIVGSTLDAPLTLLPMIPTGDVIVAGRHGLSGYG